MTHQSKGPGVGSTEALNIQNNPPTDSSSFAPSSGAKVLQCDRVLSALRVSAQTTDSLRQLAVRSPASRIMDLRKAGHIIVTKREGRQALYALVAGGAA